MLALTSCTGKLGAATLSAILSHNLIPPTNLVICTSSPTDSSIWDTHKSLGVQIRAFNFDTSDPKAFEGCTELFLVSTPRTSLDFNDAPPGSGREKHHIAAIQAAQAAGVKHIYYTSLAFGSPSKAGVMRAHLRTEEFLGGLKEGMKVTIIREGLYNESWPLYFGYYDPKNDAREEIVLAGDGPISWTSIVDLGLGTALILADQSGKYIGKTFYLSSTKGPESLSEIAGIVGRETGKVMRVKIVSREEYVEHYTEKGRAKPDVEWWSTTYGALEDKECLISDPTLDELLAGKGVKPKAVKETIEEMFSNSDG